MAIRMPNVQLGKKSLMKAILPRVERVINGYRKPHKTSSLAGKIQKAGPVFLSKLEEALRFRLENLKHEFSEWILDPGFDSVRDFVLRRNPNYNRSLYSMDASLGNLVDPQGPDLFKRAEMFEIILRDKFFTEIFIEGVKYGDHGTYPGVCKLDHQFILKLLDEKHEIEGKEIKYILDVGAGANDWLHPAITSRELASLINQGSYPNIKQIIAMDVCFSALKYMSKATDARKFSFGHVASKDSQKNLPPITQKRLSYVEANPVDSIPLKLVDIVICRNVKKILDEEGSSILDKKFFKVLREGGFYISNSGHEEEEHVYLKRNGEFERIGQLQKLANLNITMAQYLDAPEERRLSAVRF